MPDPLASASMYEAFIYGLADRSPPHPSLDPDLTSHQVPCLGERRGRVFLAGDVVLCVQEFLNFELNVIEGYGDEVSAFPRRS